MNVLITEILYQNDILFYLINGGIDNPILDFLMPLLTNFGSLIAWGVVCVLLFLFGGTNSKKVAILGLSALLVTNVAVYLLKYLIAEPRPFLALPNVELLVPENEVYSFQSSYSFPSGHTASSFAVAVVIGLRYKLNFKGESYRLFYPLIAFATMIGFSRIYIGVHYPLDVIFGAILGVISALLVLKTEENSLADKISHICFKDKFIPNRTRK